MTRLLRWSQYVCLLVGIGALAWWALVTAEARWTQASLERSLAQERRATRFTTPPAVAMPNSMPVNSMVGRIDISRIGLSAMVLEGDGAQTLAKGVGHIPGTALPGSLGNVGLAGHRDTFFRALRRVRTGDQIEVTTLHGDYRYRVVSAQIVGPEDTRVLNPSGGESVTLVTCYPFHFIGSAPKRFIVHAKKVG